MATNMQVCVFCEEKNGKIVLFTNEILLKSREVLRVRVKNKFKYSDVQLPLQVNATHGYHASCYRAFTAVAKKYFTQQICSTDCELPPLPTQTSTLMEKSNDLLMLPTASARGSASCTTTDDIMSTSPVSSNTAEFPEKSTSASISTTLSSSIIDGRSNVATSQIPVTIPQPWDTSSSSMSQATLLELPSSSKFVQPINLDSPNDNSKQLCIFCNKNAKKANGVMQKLIGASMDQFIENLRKYASDTADEDLLNKLQDKNIVYHGCERAYKNNYKASTEKGNINWHKSREIRQSVREDIISMIEDTVVNNNSSFLLSSLCNIFNNNVKQLCGEQAIAFGHEVEPRHFEASVLTPLIKDKKIKIITKNNKKVVVPYNGFILSDEEFANLATENLLLKAAMILRERVLKIKKKIAK